MNIEYSTINDPQALRALYQTVSSHSGTLARSPDECQLEYFESVLDKSAESGINIGAYAGKQLIAFIYAYKLGPKVFDHTLANLTIAVAPDYQARGIGRTLLNKFIDTVMQSKNIIRIELFTPSINTEAIKLYKSLGFKQEGVFQDRAVFKGKLVDDIAMAWVKKES